MAERYESDEVNPFKKDCCVICKQGFEDENPVTVSKKGVLTLISFSEKRGRVDLTTYLNECIRTAPIDTVLVHKTCRRNFTDQIKRDSTAMMMLLKFPL